MRQIDAMHREGQHHFWGISAKDARPESNHEETVDRPKLRDSL